jgi:hypothetical protein
MGETFTCEACGGTFTSKQELETHNRKEHAAQPSETTAKGQQKEM